MECFTSYYTLRKFNFIRVYFFSDHPPGSLEYKVRDEAHVVTPPEFPAFWPAAETYANHLIPSWLRPKRPPWVFPGLANASYGVALVCVSLLLRDVMRRRNQGSPGALYPFGMQRAKDM